MDGSRSRLLKEVTKTGPIVYWMYRDQRAADNWALLYAQELAEQYHTYVVVVVCLRPSLEQHAGTSRMLQFMLQGLEETAADLNEYNIPLELLIGDPPKAIPEFLKNLHASTVITDMMPLNDHRSWLAHITKVVDCTVIQVDAHNIVPVWVASTKQEWGAYTLRPKINKLLPQYLTDFPKLKKQPPHYQAKIKDMSDISQHIKVDTTVKLPDHWKPGPNAAHKEFQNFIKTKLTKYENNRNDPTLTAQSNLSPYLHFGQISPQRVAYEIATRTAHHNAYLEELIVRRELSDNYCWYNPNYYNPSGFPEWAQKTLQVHQSDPREHQYSLQILESAKTNDQAWNASQTQMVRSGKMHGYMRMYWAKKLLEWTNNVESAQKIAIYLNNKYEIDGRDPNGYVGIAWSLGGVHDRPWFNRPIIGTIRPMTQSGLKKKFDLEKYINTWI